MTYKNTFGKCKKILTIVFKNGVVKIRGTNECVVCVANNHLVGACDDWSDDAERRRLEDVRMITPIISEWLDRAFRDEL